MNMLKKNWYLLIVILFTLGLGAMVYLTSQKLQTTSQSVDQSQAAPAVCKLSFKIGGGGSNSTCNDAQCVPVKDNATQQWLITNCAVTDTDGDQQLCSEAGRIGICGGDNFCCPAPGDKWTKDMSACATPTATPTAIATPTPTATATPTPVQQSNSSNQQVVYVYPTAIATATPVPPAKCNGTCTVNADCTAGLACVDGSCRNAACGTQTSCICPGTTPPATATPKTPVSGGPTVLGASIIAGGMLILLVGLAL